MNRKIMLTEVTTLQEFCLAYHVEAATRAIDALGRRDLILARIFAGESRDWLGRWLYSKSDLV